MFWEYETCDIHSFVHSFIISNHFILVRVTGVCTHSGLEQFSVANPPNNILFEKYPENPTWTRGERAEPHIDSKPNPGSNQGPWTLEEATLLAVLWHMFISTFLSLCIKRLGAHA